jgi:hypothetical protein
LRAKVPVNGTGVKAEGFQLPLGFCSYLSVWSRPRTVTDAARLYGQQ